jgi:chemotaxis protein MotB
MTCSTGPWLLRARSVAALLLAALAASACVSRGNYDALAQERDQLEAKLVQAERSNASLSAERLRILDELEDLNQERNRLQTDVTKLERTRGELSKSLSQREQELAARRTEIERMRSTYDNLVSDLESQVSAGEIEIEQLREGVRLNLSQEILFPSGSAELGAGGRRVIGTVAARLVDVDYRIEVQGHTDDVPISGALARRYPSNWELAAARATEVVRLLALRGVAGERLTAISFGEYHPVSPNDSPEGRAANRRIEIRLLPHEAPIDGPVAAAPAE